MAKAQGKRTETRKKIDRSREPTSLPSQVKQRFCGSCSYSFESALAGECPVCGSGDTRVAE